MTDAPEVVPIHVAMSRVLAELPAIGKNQVNQAQGFKFRGVDDVLNALNPLLAAHGIVVVPHEVREAERSERATARGSVLYVVNLRVRYRFYGPAGDYLEAEGWGEGSDSGDKATPKAMTGAYKYVLFQTFSISTEEASQVDADRGAPEESKPATTYSCPVDKCDQGPTTAQNMKRHLRTSHKWIESESGKMEPPAPVEPSSQPAPAPGGAPAAPPDLYNERPFTDDEKVPA